MLHCATILVSSPKEAAMLKLLFVFPALIFGSILLGVGALVFLPMLALLPIVLAVGACVLALSLTAGILVFVMRLIGALMIGIGGLMIAGVGAVALFAGGFVALLLGVAAFHLLLPILFIAGLVWLIHRASHPKVPQLAQLPHLQ
jgi:hypothetical protein